MKKVKLTGFSPSINPKGFMAIGDEFIRQEDGAYLKLYELHPTTIARFGEYPSLVLFEELDCTMDDIEWLRNNEFISHIQFVIAREIIKSKSMFYKMEKRDFVDEYLDKMGLTVTPLEPSRLESITEDVKKEVERAIKKYPAMHSPHEGYAILKEEVDELWELVKIKQSLHDKVKMKEEAVQIAAMAIRFIHDLT